MRNRIMITILALTLVAGAATTAQAQGGEGRQRGGMMADPERAERMLLQGIELSAEQQVGVERIRTRFAPRLDSLRGAARQAMQSGQRNPEPMQRMMTLEQERQDSLRAVLTEEQRPAFDRNRTEMRARWPGGADRPPRARTSDDAGEPSPRRRVTP